MTQTTISTRSIARAATLCAALLVGCGGTEPTEHEMSAGEQESDVADSGQDPVPTGVEPDPIDPEISWFLPPAGDQSPSNNEDSTYRALQHGNADFCAATLTGVFADPPPNGFITGDRSYHAFLAGAHLCLGDRDSANAAFAQALSSTWVGPAGVVTASRVCNVWHRVTLMLQGAEGECDLAIDDSLEVPEQPVPPTATASSSPSPSAPPPTAPAPPTSDQPSTESPSP